MEDKFDSRLRAAFSVLAASTLEEWSLFILPGNVRGEFKTSEALGSFGKELPPCPEEVSAC